MSAKIQTSSGTGSRRFGNVPAERILTQIDERLCSPWGFGILMTAFVIFMRVLEVMFFAGLAGSSIVVFISFFEDGKELFAKDLPPESKSTRTA